MNVYPLRLTRNYWKIPLYCYHECTILCTTIMHYLENGSFSDDSSTRTCKSFNKLYPTSIEIHSFNMSQPYGLYGRLYYPDIIVIPDNEFRIQITFPLYHPTDFVVRCEGPTTLRYLIHLVCSIYRQIYQKEYETATPTPFFVSKKCSCRTDMVEYVQSMKIPDVNPNSTNGDVSDCPICYSALDTNIARLKCGHQFHIECLSQWVEKGKNQSCPCCRAPVRNCTVCNNTQTITVREEHIVIPTHLRPIHSQERNTTNGVYGIHTWDIENLRITSLYYNRILKILQVNVRGY